MKESKYLELLKNNKLEELRLKLEEEIRKSGAIKTNSKSRYNALKKMIEKQNSDRPALQGYGTLDDKEFYFTNSYLYAVLHDGCGFEKKDNFPIESLKRIDDKLDLHRLYVEVADLSYYVKSKEPYKNEYFEGMDFDPKYIKIALDILGTKDIKLFANQDKTAIIFMNKDSERVFVLGRRVY